MREYQVLGGRYRLDGEVGRGGMAVVWRAHDEVLGRAVAVKVLAGQYVTDPDARARIREEARAAARLSHPNIAQVYDFGEVPDGDHVLPYVVMELISGVTLASRLRKAPLPLDVALRCCAEVAAALTAAHEEGLVHRDIKPANIMLTRQGAKVVDFGIAAIASPGSGGRPVEIPMGTPGYIAPERLTGDGVHPATDVYALGVLLYQLIAGRSPWTAESITEMLDAHVYTEPDPLPELPHVPAAVVGLCRRCLRKSPVDRPPAREAAVILAEAAGIRIITGGARPAPVDEPSIALALRPAPDSPAVPSAAVPSAAVPSAAVPPDPILPPGLAASYGPVASPGPAAFPASAAFSGPAPSPDPDAPAGAGMSRDDAALDGPAMSHDADAPTGPVSSPGATGAAGPVVDGPPGERERRARRRKAAVVAGTLAVLAAAGVTAVLIGADDTGGGRTNAGTPAASGAVDPSATTAAPAQGSADPATGTAPGAAQAGPGGASPGASPSPAGLTRTSGTVATPGPAAGQAATSAPVVPPGPEPEPEPEPEPVPEPQQRTLTSNGGTVEAACTAAGQAQLVTYEPTKPYKVNSVNPGPATAAEVVFRHGNRYVTMTVTCSGGVPSAANS